LRQTRVVSFLSNSFLLTYKSQALKSLAFLLICKQIDLLQEKVAQTVYTQWEGGCLNMSIKQVALLSGFSANQQSISQWLAKEFFNLSVYSSADEMLLAAQSPDSHPDVIIVDESDEFRYSIINILQNDPVLGGVPLIILMDNLADTGMRFYSDLLWGVERIQKPCEPSQLINKVKWLAGLNKRRLCFEKLLDSNWAETRKDGLLALNKEGYIIYANQPAAKILRISFINLLDTHIYNLLEKPMLDIAYNWQESPVAKSLLKKQALDIRDLKLWRGDGGSVTTQTAILPLSDNECGIVGLVAFQQHTPAALRDKNIATIANVDPLSGLPIKSHLDESLVSLLQTKTKFALLLIDIDHLRHINETLGYELGDQLIHAAASRLRLAREPGLLVSMGGGRFALLLDNASEYYEIGRCAQRLQSQFKRSFLLSGHEVFCTVTIGISLYPMSGDDEGLIVAAAENALERAKVLGRNVIQFESAELNRFTFEFLSLQEKFVQALSAKEFSIKWRIWRDKAQKIIAIQPVPVWPHALQFGFDVCQLAEETNNSTVLGGWLLESIQNSPLLKKYPLLLSISLNQMMDSTFSKKIKSLVQRNKLIADKVCLVVPWKEEDAPLLIKRLGELSDLGVQLGIYINGHHTSVDAATPIYWQKMIISQAYLEKLPRERRLPLIAALTGFSQALSWDTYLDIIPDGIDRNAAFAIGVSAYGQIEMVDEDVL
jgi:diguanylate cyclase (GGDEF)-like protein